MRISKAGKLYGFQKGKVGYWKSKTFSKEHIENMRLASTPAIRKQSSIRCSKTMKGNNHRKDFVKKLSPEEHELWEKENGRKISRSLKANTEYMEILKARMMGNNYHDDFVKTLTKEERRLFHKLRGEKLSLWYKNNPKYVEEVSKRMMGNDHYRNYLLKHPVWKKPAWDRHVPFQSCPEFIDIPKTELSVVQQINYFTTGSVSGLL